MNHLSIENFKQDMMVPIIIPAYEPDDRFVELAQRLNESGTNYIIVVDDGSGEIYASIFRKVKSVFGDNCVVLHHEINKGKGAALKMAFRYVLNNYPDAVGVVTADSDGQHSVGCIQEVSNALVQNKESLILGVRCFEGDDIPWKSEMGNKITRKVMKFVTGLDVSDTQTGLRGIPIGFMEELLDIKEDRFEFEMKMLLESIDKYPIVEVPIHTIYDSKENHSTHFNPWIDSIKIYKVLGGRFIRYVFSSLSSCIIDIVLFTIFCVIFKNTVFYYIALSTVLARLVSATYNCIINYKLVFKSDELFIRVIVKYAALVIVQMATSAILVTGGVWTLKVIPETVVKIVVDTCLFFVSYTVQRKLVF